MMKSKKLLKRSLSAFMCTAMMLNPVMSANALYLSEETQGQNAISEENKEEKIPAAFYIWEIYDGSPLAYEWDFEASVSVSVSSVADNNEVECFELGKYTTHDENMIYTELPSVIKDKYGDRSKYKVEIKVTPIDMSEFYLFTDKDGDKAYDIFTYEYNNEDKLKCDIYFRGKISHSQSGYIDIELPEKRRYKVGEELDLTGGMISGNGSVHDDKGNDIYWKIEKRELTVDDLDISEFDNTKPGDYMIKVSSRCFDDSKFEDYYDGIYYKSFLVNVSDDSEDSQLLMFKIDMDEVENDQYFFSGLPFGLKMHVFDEDSFVEDIFEYPVFTIDSFGYFTIEIPAVYNDTDKYTVWFEPYSADFPEYREKYITIDNDKIMYDGDPDRIINIGISEEKGVPLGLDSRYIYDLPTKRIYKIGEEFDITGASKRGSGILSGPSGYWDDFGSPVTMDEVDISEFDNTRPGVYTIRGKGIGGEFVVYVTDEEKIPNGKMKVKINEVSEEDKEYHYLPLNGLKFDVRLQIVNEDHEGFEVVDLGIYDSKGGNTFTLELSDELMELYLQERLGCFLFYPVDLTDDLCLANTHWNYEDAAYYEYKGTPEEEVEILLREPRVVTVKGKIDFTPPEKLVYNLYEKYDFTGASYTSDLTAVFYDGDEIKLNSFCIPDYEDFDTSAVDRTKPGEYTIKLKYKYQPSEIDVVKYDFDMPEFKITVVGDKDEEKKISTLRGDANLDNEVTLADAVAISQFIANPDKHIMSEQAMENADITGDDDGVTTMDALVIQKYMLKIIDTL